MDALSLSLRPWSGVGLALSGWAARINLAVAEAERRQNKLYGPSNDLLMMAAALGVESDDPLREWLMTTYAELVEEADTAEPRLAQPQRPPRAGRIWSREDDPGARRPGRRRR